jgi:hypothetical protein
VVFASDDTAYVTISNGDVDTSHSDVWAITSAGATKVLDVDAPYVSAVTVAPDGTVYVAVAQLDNGAYKTTVQKITPPDVV